MNDKVLVVEDEPTLLETLEYNLTLQAPFPRSSPSDTYRSRPKVVLIAASVMGELVL